MLGNDVHLRATFEPVFSRVAVRLDVDLGDRVDAGDAAVITAGIAVTAIHAVRVDRVPAAPLELRNGRLEAASPGILVGDDLNAGQCLEYGHWIAAFYRD